MDISVYYISVYDKGYYKVWRGRGVGKGQISYVFFRASSSKDHNIAYSCESFLNLALLECLELPDTGMVN